MAQSQAPAAIAQLVRARIDELGVSEREIARRYAGAGASEKAVENRRRWLLKVLSGETKNPHRPQRIRLARALGWPDDHLLPNGLPTWEEMVWETIQAIVSRVEAIEDRLARD